jgi:DNA-3-methyladenine glycosylase I
VTEPGRGPVIGPDGQPRCPWGLSTPEYVTYHDDEWGRPVRDDRGIFERLCLEAFQSGLSWLTILRKRENFRAAFGGFAMESVAAYGPDDVARLMADAGIVRNRAKIDAAIRNARAALELPDGLAALIWSYAPVPSVPDSSGDPRRSGGPRTLEDLPAASAESKALARDLKRRGFAFTGPVTVYSTMQACGIVDDHLFGCFRRGAYT